jgi:NAD-dependent dihydropyrimidine dehydrogenase PreA subunit
MEMLDKDLRKKGLHLDSAFSLIMPESYVCLPFMYTDTPQREHEKISKASEDLDRYIEMIKEKKVDEVHTQRGLTPWTFSHVIGAYFNNYMITDKKFTVDTDLCIHCGKCEKVCPTGDLLMKDGMPTWQHDDSCTNCLACYHHCPQHAINYGSITRKRGQYYFGHKG